MNKKCNHKQSSFYNKITTAYYCSICNDFFEIGEKMEEIPNAETIETIENIENGIGLHKCDSVEQLFKELDEEI